MAYGRKHAPLLVISPLFSIKALGHMTRCGTTMCTPARYARRDNTLLTMVTAAATRIPPTTTLALLNDDFYRATCLSGLLPMK